MSDELTELPEGWGWISLEVVADAIDPQPSHRTPPECLQGVPYIGIGDINDDETINFNRTRKVSPDILKEHQERYILKKGDFIFGKIGTLGKPFKLPEPFDYTLSANVILLQSKRKLLTQDWLFYFMKSPFIEAHILKDSSATSQAAFGIKKIRLTPIAIAPINEQKRIVAKIEELNDRTQRAKEALETIPQLCDRFRQSVLAAAFRGDLTADWREQNPDVEPASVLLERIRRDRRQKWEEEEFIKLKVNARIVTDEKWKLRYKESLEIDSFNLPELPSGWNWASIEQFADVGTGATPLRNEPKYYENGTISWITSGALNNLFIDKAEEFITHIAIQETNAKIFPKNTLLVAMYGEGKTRGKVSELLIEAATNQACAALIIEGIASKIQPIVKLFFQKNYSDIRRLASGGVQPNLNLSMIKSMLVPLPPLQEQVEIIQIVARLMSMIETVEQQYQNTKDKLNQLNQSILAKAFRGELVPQDPDDEPASVLLEQIRAEREKLNNGKQKSQRTSKRKSKTVEEQGVT